MPPESAHGGATPEHLHALLDTAAVGIVEFDAHGRAVLVNDHWRSLTGCTAEVPIDGDTLLGLIHPDDRERITDRWTTCLRDGEGFSFLTRFVNPDGRVRAVQGQVEPCRAHGEVAAFVGTLIDVEPALADDSREGEVRYRQLHEQAPVGHLIVNLDGTLHEANRAFAEMLGARQGDLIGRTPLEVFHADDAQRAIRLLTSLVEGTTEFVLDELRMQRDDGTTLWVAGGASIVRDPAGHPSHIHAVVFDVSERREAEERLRESEDRYRTTVNALAEGVLLHRNGELEAVNQSALDIFGLPVEDLEDGLAIVDKLDPVDEHGHPLGHDELSGIIALREGRPVSGQLAGLTPPGGERRWVTVNVRPLHDDEGEVEGVVTTFADVTERKLAEDALRESEDRYRSLVRAAPLGQLIADLDGRITEVNQALADLLGMDPLELAGRGPWSLVHPEDRESVARGAAGLLEGDRATFSTEGRLLRPGDGSVLWVNSHTTLLRDARGEPRMYLTLLEDVTERRRTEERAQRLANIVESTSDLVGMVDPGSGSLLYLNRAARDLFGLHDRDVTELDVRELCTDEAAGLWETDISVGLEMGRTWTGELDMVRADEQVIHVLLSITADSDHLGRLRHISFVGRDVTDQRRREIDLAHQATHDPLTDLPNRSFLLELVDHALSRARREQTRVALLFLDLDRFKQVNDSLGHETGDRLLVHVAGRITRAVRPADTVARLGGDEFVVLCEDIADEHQTVAIAQRITSALQTRPFRIDGATIPMTASVGIALSADEPSHPEALLRDADAAMYRAKDRGRARHELFDESMRKRSARRLAVADELAEAIERDQITVHYQPLVDLRTGLVTAVEALARWEHPVRGTLPPSEFIPLAEETGLIVGLGLSVLSRSCDQVRRWEVELGSRVPKVHVNISARQLAHTSLPRLVEGVIEQSLIDPDRVCLEMTESVLMDDAARSVATLEELKGIGVELAIDDFGTGYSSLAYLRRFPVDIVKIDRSFVDGLGPDPDDSAIVSVIVALAHSLELGCVAEGVETVEQLMGLRALGCELAQGFHFARPQPVEELDRLLTKQFDLATPA